MPPQVQIDAVCELPPSGEAGAGAIDVHFADFFGCAAFFRCSSNESFENATELTVVGNGKAQVSRRRRWRERTLPWCSGTRVSAWERRLDGCQYGFRSSREFCEQNGAWERCHSIASAGLNMWASRWTQERPYNLLCLRSQRNFPLVAEMFRLVRSRAIKPQRTTGIDVFASHRSHLTRPHRCSRCSLTIAATGGDIKGKT